LIDGFYYIYMNMATCLLSVLPILRPFLHCDPPVILVSFLISFSRSTDHLLLVVPRVKLKTRGEKAFPVAGPKLWNSLPLYIRQSQTITIFKSNLKTYYYSLAFAAMWEFVLLFYCLLFLLSWSCWFVHISIVYSTMLNTCCFKKIAI